MSPGVGQDADPRAAASAAAGSAGTANPTPQERAKEVADKVKAAIPPDAAEKLKAQSDKVISKLPEDKVAQLQKATEGKPEIPIAAAFVGAFLFAKLLKRIAG